MVDAHRLHSLPKPFSAIRASVLLPILKELDARWGNSDGLLAHQGILRAQIADPYALVLLPTYLAIFETAAEVLQDPLLGAKLGSVFKPADLGPVGVMFSAAPTIGRAFEGLSRSINALQGGTAATLQPSGSGDVAWSYRIIEHGLGSRRQDSEFTLSATCQLVRASFSAKWDPVEVHLEHSAPADPTPLQRIFRAPVRFGQSANRLLMARASLERVYRAEDQGLSSILERHIAELQKTQNPGGGLKDQVRLLIEIYLGHLPITLRAFARETGLSPRTLQRRLTEEGTSLRELVRAHRAELARRGLEENGTGCAALAESLGYADGTVFWRAYKSWTGNSPSGRKRRPAA